MRALDRESSPDFQATISLSEFEADITTSEPIRCSGRRSSRDLNVRYGPDSARPGTDELTRGSQGSGNSFTRQRSGATVIQAYLQRLGIRKLRFAHNEFGTGLPCSGLGAWL